jgi:predicted phage tail protein
VRLVKTIRLYGPLAKFVGQRELKAEVRSPAEAVRFLIVNFPGVHEHMAEQFYCVKAGSFLLDDETQLHFPVGSTEEIKIVPVVQGSSGVGKILAGIGLVVASIFIPGSAAFLGIGLKGLAFSIGASLVLGGVAEILAPTPKSFNRDERDPTASRVFSGVANVSRAGIPLPVVYGETAVGSVVVSLGVRAKSTDEDTETDEDGPTQPLSVAFARIIDVLSEGQIEGFPSARKQTAGSAAYDNALLKDIFLNNTPILAPGANAADPDEDDFNFQDVTVKYRLGGINQNTVPGGFRLIEAEQSVESQVTMDQSVTRQITNVNVSEVRVTITSPTLRKVDGSSTEAAEFTIEINAAYGNGDFPSTPVKVKTISELSDGPYQWSYKFDIDPAGAFPVRIRVRRTADDPDQSTADAIQNDSVWTSYTEIIRAKMAYPGSAYVALNVSARQFNSIPQRRYRIRGRLIRIPTNATVRPKNGRLVYSGTWNGTFTENRVWCSCPAWILWDLLISRRYGLGDHITTDNLDKWEFFAASVYANQLVSNGFGGQEARFSCNVSMQTEADAYAAINELAGVMRSMPIWSLGGLSLSQERPRSVVIGFDENTVEGGVFNYSGSSGKTRANVVVVGWFNRDIAEIEYEEVIDEAAVAKYGAVKKDITAFACTSRGQAIRLGKWMVASEQQEAQVVTFTTDIRSGIQIRPGDVFVTQDPVHGNAFEQWKLLTIKETAPEKYEVTGIYYNPNKFSDIDTGIKFSSKTFANTIDPEEEN